jgi:hypothetical protein
MLIIQPAFNLIPNIPPLGRILGINQSFKDKAQTALFKDPVRTAL